MKTIEELKNAEDKLSIFLNFEKLTQYISTVRELIEAFSTCLSDNEKFEAITKSDYFERQAPYTKSTIIMTIKDDKIKNKIIQDSSIVEKSFEQYSFMKFCKTLNDEGKMFVLNCQGYIEKFDLKSYEIRDLIEALSEDNRVLILSNKELVKKLGIDGFNLTNLIIGLKDDSSKSKLAKEHELNEYDQIGVIKSFSDENKKRIILGEKVSERFLIDIISSLGTDAIIDFINNEQEFLTKKEIKIYQIIKRMLSERQIQVAERVEEIHLPEAEKRRILACLDNKTKEKLDLEKIDEKYRSLIDIRLETEFPNMGMICPKLDDDFTKYKDLDELISINPLQIVKSEEDRKKLIKLFEICPNVSVEDNLIISSSTGAEYIKGEEWVSSVLQGIQQEWTDVQKLAYIDTIIGKRISYTPNFGTEVENEGDERSLWKIMTSGYGVCNGIAQVEQYLLSRVGIEAELVSGEHHAFVKVNNIEIPTENGIIRGDTLVDPTWNLTASRYGAKPNHFCKSYEELRKADIDDEGKDHECHKNDDLQGTINMDEETLRKVYKSIGIADKDGNFPIIHLIQQARKVDETSPDIQTNIKKKFEILKNWCPEFATCHNSTINVLRDVLFENNEKFDFQRCIASRVYDRADAQKDAVLYLYMELQGVGKQFFYADKQSGEFVQMPQDEFERKFECYEVDLKENKRPWETNVEIEERKENSSGKVVAEEGR